MKKTTKVNVRIISVTNKDLPQSVKEGKFREDLYYRTDVIQLKTPQLKERLDDIPILCRQFIENLNKKSNTKKTLQGHPQKGLKFSLTTTGQGMIDNYKIFILEGLFVTLLELIWSTYQTNS
ncbi:sigma 54-interacting transcriptional regulator [Oceanobacillus salinisoli]|uniref:sigma 54-interacting transcriptional regulator n=1 Tax=Oceanobacillus salinisoli TaxID=2678611 RepID=UPI0012E24806|nr:sigma 54-interacting transcriptional regulator [Oceanobacillus salinisoli]